MRLALILACAASPAAADLTFCNETDARATVAIGYANEGVWTSEGWWGIDPGTCRAIVTGDLPRRYYYWRATTKAGAIGTGAYNFCTQPSAFTIEGDADCEARGFQTAAFREEDIGEAKDHTITLTDPGGKKPARKKPAAAATPPAAPAPQADNGPGTFGEPYTIVAEFRGCWAVNEERECEFFAEGWRYIASETGPTDPDIIDALDKFSDGTRLQLSGDMISYAGDRADIMIRAVAPAQPAAAPPPAAVSSDGLMDHMQGYWESDDGSGYAWIVKDNFLREIYDGNIMRESYFEIAPTCAASDGKGPVIIAWPEPNEGDGPACYVVTETAQRHLAIYDVLEERHHSFSYSN